MVLEFPPGEENINQYLEIFLVQNGLGNLVDEASNETLFNKPEAVEAMDFLRQLKEAGLVD